MHSEQAKAIRSRLFTDAGYRKSIKADLFNQLPIVLDAYKALGWDDSEARYDIMELLNRRK